MLFAARGGSSLPNVHASRERLTTRIVPPLVELESRSTRSNGVFSRFFRAILRTDKKKSPRSAIGTPSAIETRR